MGAKLSNFPWNLRNNSNINSTNNNNNVDINEASQQTNNDCIYKAEIPTILVDEMMESKTNSIENCEPTIFPKLTPDEKCAPVNYNNNFRIHPILQQGEKLSDTHYWFINEPKHKRCHSARVKRHPPELYMNASTIDQCSKEEPELPFDLNQQISQEYSKFHLQNRPIKRGNSETDKSYLYNMQRGLVIRLMFAIPDATEMECNSVLIGANWDFSVAEKRLKVDMLHRKGYVNQQRCTYLLEKNKWDFKSALTDAEKECNNYLKYCERQNSNSPTSISSSRSYQHQKSDHS